MRMKRLSDLCLAAACAAVLAGCSTTLVREDPRTIRLGDSGVTCATTPLVKELLAMNGTELLGDALKAFNEQLKPFFLQLGISVGTKL